MKKYKIVLGILSFISILILFLYFSVQNQEIKNILGNIFAGIVSGIILAIVFNIKDNYREERERHIKRYQEILEKSQQNINKQNQLKDREKIAIYELIELYSDISNYFDDIKSIKTAKVEEKKVENLLEEYIDICMNRIGELVGKISDKEIELEQYKTNYQTELDGMCVQVFVLNIALKRDMREIILDMEKLNRSII